MTDITYCGLAIGGPLDGHMISSRSRVYETHGEGFPLPTGIESISLMPPRFIYVHVIGLRGCGGYKIDFFVPPQTTIEDIMKALVDTYQRKTTNDYT